MEDLLEEIDCFRDPRVNLARARAGGRREVAFKTWLIVEMIELEMKMMWRWRDDMEKEMSLDPEVAGEDEGSGKAERSLFSC